MLTRLTLLFVSFFLLVSHLQAIVHYDGDATGNLTAPGTGVPFYAVARVCNNGGSGTSGSAVYIRGKYLLSADHVQLRSHVTFDGSTYWARDTSFVPIAIGTTDMRMIKLVKDPGLAEVTLHTPTSGDDISSTTRIKGQSVTTDVIGTLVGWGRGRDLNVADTGSGSTNIWKRGYESIPPKRWGTNRIDGLTTLDGLSASPNVPGYPYNYSALRTDLDADAGNDEAGATEYDSGSGIFVQNGGTWTLAGIATLISSQDPFTFSSSGNNNYFVRVQDHVTDIEGAIPDTATYSGWKIDHGLYGANALDTADTDDDGITQLNEFAFGGDPNENDISILPTHALAVDGDTYLELSVTRPTSIQGITYTPITTTDLTNWPSNSTGIVDDTPTPSDNGDGTETLIYRRSQVVSGADQAFIRVEVSEN